MKLSIIVLNYNTAKITLQCIKSIEKFPFSLNDEKYEVILVDNNSTDNSDKLFKNFKSKNFKYKYIRNKINLGFSKGNNVGLRIAKGKYKLLLNSDTEVTKNALNILVQTAEENSDVGILGAKLLNSDGSVQNSVHNLPTVLRTLKQYWLGKKVLDKYYPKSKKLTEVESVVGAAMLITPDVIKKIGLLNEKFFMFFEDLDYCRLARNNNIKVFYLPSAKIIHHHGKSGKNITNSENQWRRLIPSSKIYHGKLNHYTIFFITWLSQKIRRLY